MKKTAGQFTKRMQSKIDSGELVEVVKLYNALRPLDVRECYKNNKLPDGRSLPPGVKLWPKEYETVEKARIRKFNYFWFVLEVTKDKVALQQTYFVEKSCLKDPILI